MADQHRETKVKTFPHCDFCPSGALYDGQTTAGLWANMCNLHFQEHGVGLGLGKGQRLVVEKAVAVDPDSGGRRICESCLDAAHDEGAEDDIAELVMLELGADVADHPCDAVESGGSIKCLCPCRWAGRLE